MLKGTFLFFERRLLFRIHSEVDIISVSFDLRSSPMPHILHKLRRFHKRLWNHFHNMAFFRDIPPFLSVFHTILFVSGKILPEKQPKKPASYKGNGRWLITEPGSRQFLRLPISNLLHAVLPRPLSGILRFHQLFSDIQGFRSTLLLLQ